MKFRHLDCDAKFLLQDSERLSRLTVEPLAKDLVTS